MVELEFTRSHTTSHTLLIPRHFFVSNFGVNDALTPRNLEHSVTFITIIREIRGSILAEVSTVMNEEFRDFPLFQQEISRYFLILG
jgi:hypothetical protein